MKLLGALLVRGGRSRAFTAKPHIARSAARRLTIHLNYKRTSTCSIAGQLPTTNQDQRERKLSMRQRRIPHRLAQASIELGRQFGNKQAIQLTCANVKNPRVQGSNCEGRLSAWMREA